MFKRLGWYDAPSSRSQKLSMQKLSEKRQPKSLVNVPHSTENMRDLEALAIWAENRSRQDFLLMHQMLLHQAPNSIKEDLYFSYSLLLGSSLPHPQYMSFSPAPQAKVNPPLAIYIKPEPERTPPSKRRHPSADAQKDTSGDEDFPPSFSGGTSKPQEREVG